MTILYVIMFLFLLLFIGGSWFIHEKRTCNRYVDSYIWFVKLLK
jgi:hypothetical protein